MSCLNRRCRSLQVAPTGTYLRPSAARNECSTLCTKRRENGSKKCSSLSLLQTLCRCWRRASTSSSSCGAMSSGGLSEAVLGQGYLRLDGCVRAGCGCGRGAQGHLTSIFSPNSMWVTRLPERKHVEVTYNYGASACMDACDVIGSIRVVDTTVFRWRLGSTVGIVQHSTHRPAECR